MKYSVLLFACFLLMGSAPVWAQQVLSTTRQVTLIDDDKPTLNSEKKEKLSMSISGRAFTGAVYLPPGTSVKVLSRSFYNKKETVGPTADLLKRDFNVAVVEVLDGEHKGTKGWVVIDVKDEGKRAEVFLSAPVARPDKPSTSPQSAVDPNLPDLQIGSCHVASSAVAGKVVYGVSVVNMGGSEAKGAFDVTVQVAGKTVKTERVRNLPAGGAHSFTFEVSEGHVRNNAPVVITVDSSNGVKEGNESNNIYTTQL